MVNYNQQTLQYLSIFKDDMHPSLIKGKGKSKEGFSLFILFEKFINTKSGNKKLKQLFFTPTYDTEIIKVKKLKKKYIKKKRKDNKQLSFFID